MIRLNKFCFYEFEIHDDDSSAYINVLETRIRLGLELKFKCDPNFDDKVSIWL